MQPESKNFGFAIRLTKILILLHFLFLLKLKNYTGKKTNRRELHAIFNILEENSGSTLCLKPGVGLTGDNSES